jgi:glycyl-tRNA synthetase beta chain
VALADKIDTLTGFWAIDEKPTGSKDPYALRRAALGVIRLVLGNGLRADLQTFITKRVIRHALWSTIRSVGGVDQTITAELDRADADNQPYFRKNFNGKPEDGWERNSLWLFNAFDGASDLLSFFHDRLKVYLKDQGIRHDIIDACLAMPGNDDLTLLVKRATALSETLKTEDGANLLQGFKRANNILSQAEAKDGVEYSFGADLKFAETEEERALFAALDQAEARIGPAMAAEDFGTAMAAMAALRAPIDAFFTAVQVNSDNPIVRRNRLNLLHRIRTVCSGVADLTRIEG